MLVGWITTASFGQGSIMNCLVPICKRRRPGPRHEAETLTASTRATDTKEAHSSTSGGILSLPADGSCISGEHPENHRFTPRNLPSQTTVKGVDTGSGGVPRLIFKSPSEMKGDDLSVPQSAGKLKTGSVAHISAGVGLSASHGNELRKRALSFSLLKTIGNGCVVGKALSSFGGFTGLRQRT